MRKSLSANSRLRAESQETRAVTKKPNIAGKLGTMSTDEARTLIIMLLIPLKTKLVQGASKMLAMMIGMTKPNRLRPADTCSGVSLNEKIAVNRSRKRIAAARPDQ